MSYIPGTEYRMIPNMAPSGAHGSNHRTMRRRRATTEKDMKLLSMMQQTPEHAKKLQASLALSQNFLNQQESSDVLNEMERRNGRLSFHRDPSLRDGVALKNRINYLEKRMSELKPQSLAGLEGLYLY